MRETGISSPWLRASPRESRPRLAVRTDRRAAAVAAGVIGLAVLAGWVLLGPGENDVFARSEKEFLSGPAIERRIEAASKRLGENPQDLRALSELGLLHFQKGREFYPDAINELEDARRLGALDARHFYFLGAMYQAEGLYPFAIAEYQRFLRHFPDDREAMLLLAKLLYQGGQAEEAASHFKRLLEEGQRDAVVLENLGLCLKAAKSRDEAAQAFQALAALGPMEKRRADLHLGRLAAEDGDPKSAMRHFAALLPIEGQPELGAPPAEVHAEIAANYDKLSSPKLAREHWGKVLSYDPKNAKARRAVSAIDAAQRRAARQAKRNQRR